MARHTPGNYVPLDVNYPHDRAIREAGTNAELLFIRALAYAKRTRSGGFLPRYDLQVAAVGMRSIPAAVASLLRVALWEEVEGGWRIRSWERWNASEQAVSAGGRLGNHKRWHSDRDVTDPDCEHCADRGAIGGRSGGESAPNRGGDSQGKGREGKERTTTREADASAPDLFDEFWSAYPRKTAKRNAEKAWKAAVKRAEPPEILAGLRRAKFSDDPQFIAHPATWLNGDRWADQAQTSLSLLPTSDGFTAAELDQILGPPRPLPQPPRGLDENAMWEWEQQTRREQRAERVRQANVKLGRSA